jgi:hypothetical protein
MIRHPDPRPATADWTETDTHDPGVTMLQVLAFVAELLTAMALLHKWWRRHRRAG